MKSATDAKNQQTNYTYFADDNLAEINYTNTNGQPLNPPTPSVSYTYDPNYNRVASMIDGSCTTAYGYNPVTVPAVLGANRLASIDGPITNDTITFTYDELGRECNGVASIHCTFEIGHRCEEPANQLHLFADDNLAEITYTDTNGQQLIPPTPFGQLHLRSELQSTGDDDRWQRDDSLWLQSRHRPSGSGRESPGQHRWSDRQRHNHLHL